MSTCIGREGEYSEHKIIEGNYICDRCGVLDEEGIFAERDALRAEVQRIRDFAERGVAAEARAVLDLEAEVERLQAIVTTAALETYTPDGSERFVAQFWEVLRRAKAAEAKVVRVERLMENREAERPFKTVTASGVPFPTVVTVDDVRAALSGPDAEADS